MGYDSDITSINNIEALEGIMTAFQNKTSYVNYDFSNTTGKILSYQFGHTHFDVRYYDEELNIATMNIGTSGQYNVGVESDAMLGGTAGVELFRRPYTETEALFDLVSATTNKVYELRFGAGENTNYTLK